MSGYLARNPLMTDEPQFGPPPVVAGRPVLPNPLAMPAGDWRDTVAPQPTQAEAADATKQAYAEWLARDRAEQVRLGHVDPATGQLTPEGWRAQAQTVAGGFGPADIGAMGIGAIKTYHGSPHLFEPTLKNPLGEFRLDKIGTGEGSQAFGQGMYTAEAEQVAREGYRDKLAGRTTYLDDVPYDQLPKETQGLLDTLYSRPVEARIKEAEGIIPELTAKVKRGELDQWSLDSQLSYIEQLRGLQGRDISYRSPGHMYEVNLNAEPHEFLHWDKKFSEQSPQVQKILSDIGAVPDPVEVNTAGHFGYSLNEFKTLTPEYQRQLMDKLPANHANYARDPKGGEIYQDFKAKDPVAAATALRNAGIPGVRYLDRGSRGGDPNAPDATHNYAVWTPEIMDIIRRYGIAGLVGGGAAATAAGGQKDNTQ